MVSPHQGLVARTLGTGSLKVRLMGLVVLVALLTVTALSISLTVFMTARTTALLKERASSLTTVMASLLSAEIDFEQYDAASAHLGALASSGATYAAVYLRDGRVIARWGTLPEVVGAAQAAAASSRAHTTSLFEDDTLIHIGIPVGTTGATRLVIGFSRREEQRERNAIANAALFTALLLLPLLGLVGIRVAGSIARPLLDMATTAEAIARGDRVALTQLPTSRRDEAGKVARAFLQLLEKEHESQQLLEVRVTERTEELSLRIAQLAEAHEQVAASARAAGMAEIASGVLHNIGNVLNSVNVSAQLATDTLNESRLPALRQIVELMTQNKDDLAALYASDKGPRLHELLALTADSLRASQEHAIEELAGLRTNVDHINTLVATQQTYASTSGYIETFKLADVVRAALRINFASFGRDQVEIVQQVEDVEMTTDRHKMIQILVNLMTNARHAVKDRQQRRVEIVANRCALDAGPEDGVRIMVRDTGLGIDDDTMSKLFRHGFTTKKNGHGFGLHASANSAKELGGSLHASSAGRGHGATFTLEIPAIIARDAAMQDHEHGASR